MIAVVTDSTCDIPPAVLEQTGIHVVPALISIGQETLRDGVDLSREAFYERLPHLAVLPTTASPSPQAFAELYERVLHRASTIVSVHAASRLSGICNAARLAAIQVASERIHIIDSGQLSMGLGWVAIAASEAARKSETLEAVLHCVHDTVRRVRVYAATSTLTYLARSGRLNMVQAGLGSLLDIKPVLELCDGVVSTVGRVRTWSRAVGALADRVRSTAPVEQLAVMHSNCVDCAADLLEHIRDMLPNPAGTIVVNVTSVIGTHVGPHAVGVAAVAAT